MTRRPFEGVELELGDLVTGPLRDVEASLRHFGTIAFGIEQIRRLFRLSETNPGHVDGSIWFAFVPEVYREAAAGAVERAFAEHRGRKISRERGIDPFVEDLCREIWKSIEPVRA